MSILTHAALLCAALIVIYWFTFRQRSIAVPPAPAFSEAEFVTIILAAVTAVLAALAIVLAVAGAVGYVTIKDAVKAAAERKAAEVAREVASQVATRAAESAATFVSSRSEAAGNEIAEVAGNEDAGTS